MADVARIDIEQVEGGWLVRVSNPGVRPQEYHCATKAQADNLAAVMSGTKMASNLPASKGAAAPPPGAGPSGPAAGSGATPQKPAAKPAGPAKPTPPPGAKK